MAAESSAPDPTDTRLMVAETVGSVCWLAMDAAWMLGWKPAATALVVPGVLAHLLLFFLVPRTTVAIAVTASLSGWLGMNAAWMLSEIWALPALLSVAKGLCATATGFLLLAFSHSRWRPEARARMFAGFRRLRVALHPRPRPQPVSVDPPDGAR